MHVNYASNRIDFWYVPNYSIAKLWFICFNVFNDFVNYVSIIKNNEIKDVSAIDTCFGFVDNGFLYFCQSGMKILN